MVLLDKGRIVANGTPADLRASTQREFASSSIVLPSPNSARKSITCRC